MLRPAFLDASARELAALSAQVTSGVLLVGFPERHEGRRHNAMAVIRDGRVAQVYRKQCLPNYTVFDEERYFTPGDAPCVFEVDGVRCGVVICEDIWFPAPAAQAKDAGAQVLWSQRFAVPHAAAGASPRTDRCAFSETGLAIVYVNRVGGQDELVFDGASFVVDAQGGLAQQLPAWHETLAIADFDGATSACPRRARPKARTARL